MDKTLNHWWNKTKNNSGKIEDLPREIFGLIKSLFLSFPHALITFFGIVGIVIYWIVILVSIIGIIIFVSKFF